jgi:hypothetical protein
MVTKKYILSQKRLPGQNTLAYYTKAAIAMSHKINKLAGQKP